MRHRFHNHPEKMDHNPLPGIGMFFILLGIALLIATNDLLHLGSMSRYFTWQTGMIFIGVLLLLNLRFTGGLILIAAGVWFLLDDFFIVTPEIVKTLYWPAVIVLIGLSFIISSFFNLKK
jgi:LiaF transmembrane domain